jgi:hypothetical protein
VLPDHLFVRLSLTEDEERQNEETLRPWVDPHNLREVNGVWWKEGWRVVTGDLAYQRQVVCYVSSRYAWESEHVADVIGPVVLDMDIGTFDHVTSRGSRAPGERCCIGA